MRNRIVLLSILALALWALPASAEEIIYFTNGTSLPVRAHEVDGEMIKVDLGGDAFMAFPMSQVDRIEAADGSVQLRQSSHANQILTPSASSTVFGTPSRDGSKQLQYEPPHGMVIEPDGKGVASYAPFANSGHPGKAKLRISGDQNVINHRTAQNPSEGIVGASKVGTRAVLPGNGPPKKNMRGISKKDE